jgi:hypothetical protein
MLKSAQDAVDNGAKRIIVSGSPSTGKSLFSVSASSHSGETLPAQDAIATDVAVLQTDANGVQGAISGGLTPGLVADYSALESYDELRKQLASDLMDLKPMVADGRIKFVIVELTHISNLLLNKLKPDSPALWGKVGAEGMTIYQAFSVLKGATVIANAHLRAAASPVESAGAAEAANAKAVGGARSLLEVDLPKSILAPWRNNASLEIARESRRTKDGMEFFSHTQSDAKFPAKSRFGAVLKPIEPGERTLNSILRACYKK